MIEKIAILGVGLLGGSLGLAVKKRFPGAVVSGYGHRIQTLHRARELGAIDAVAESAVSAVDQADLVILGVPVGLIPPLLREIAPAVSPGAIVTDVGSTKASIVAAGEQCLGQRFVGSHPMAGSEKRGVEFSRDDLFEGAVCILTPTANTNPAALEALETFWQRLGMKPHRLSPVDHDRLVCQISHLPHAVAAALVMAVQTEAFDLAGRGFADATRIAAGDAGLWRDILADNRQNLLGSLDQLEKHLGELRRLLQSGRERELADWLNQAALRRGRLANHADLK